MKAKKGFTLVEILIVVIILGILAAIVVPQFSDAGENAKLSTLKSNLQTVRAQIQLYTIEVGSFPTQLAFATEMSPTYLERIPDNPFTGGNAVDGGDWLYDDTNHTFNAADGGTTNGEIHNDL